MTSSIDPTGEPTYAMLEVAVKRQIIAMVGEIEVNKWTAQNYKQRTDFM